MDKLYLMLQTAENFKNLNKAIYLFTDEINDRVKGTLDFQSENSMSNEEYEKVISQLKRMSKQQRDNYMIDLMYGVLTNETSVASQTRPGNFDTLKRDAYIFDILENIPNKKIIELIKQKKNKDDSEILNNLFDLILKNFTDKELEKLSEQYKRFNNLLSPTSQLYFHNQNMAGLTLVGIYANGTSHHALMQDQGLMLSNNVEIIINGHKAKYFDNVKDFYGNLISTNLAEPQAASVDNIKNPVLARLNQNRFTANIMPTLLRLGYSLHDINLFLKQPSIMRITTSYLRGDGLIDSIIDEVLQEYYDLNKGLPEISKAETLFSNNFLAKQLLIAKDDVIVNNKTNYVKMYDKDGNYIGEMEDDESMLNSLRHLSPDYENYEDVISYYKNQIKIIDMFKEIYKAANAMTNLVQCTRSDTQSGGAGPMIADTESKIYKWEEIINDPKFCIEIEDGNITQLQKIGMLSQYNKSEDNDELRFNMYNSRLPFLQAFYTFGLEGSRKLFSKYFPQLQEPFIQMVKQMLRLTKYNIDSETLNDLYSSFFDYCATSTNFFGEHDNEGVEKRQYFIREFPDKFKKMVDAIPELKNNEFIKRLKVTFVDNTFRNVAGAGDFTQVKVIQFRNVGQLTAALKDKYIRYWENMLYSNDARVRHLAINLFRYSFYRHGFKFGPTSFMHLCPTAVKASCPEYVQLLRNMTNEDWMKNHIFYADYEESINELLIKDKTPSDFTKDGNTLYTGNFADQYIRNNITNYKFVVLNIIPQLVRDKKGQQKNLSSIKFIGKNRFGRDIINYRVTLTIPSYNDLTIQDKRLIKERLFDDLDNEYWEMMPYFSVRIANELVYYKAENSTSNGQVTYHRVLPLGYPNQFIEYDQTASPDSMESVFWFQNWKGILVIREKNAEYARKKQQQVDISKGNQAERNIYDEMVNGQRQNDYVAVQQNVPQPMEEKSIPYVMPSNTSSDPLGLSDDDSDSEEMKLLYEDNTLFSNKIQKHKGNWTRLEAIKNPRILYVFTDNTDRNSGSGIIPANSWYSKKYGEGHHYPTMTAAVVRGLENSRPISTQRWYHNGAKGETGRWTDASIEEFEQVIREELEEIVKEFNTGKYDIIMFPDGDGLFNTNISNITKTRTPQLYQALAELLHEYGFDSLIPNDIKNEYQTQSLPKEADDIPVDKKQMIEDNTCKPTE